MKTLAKCVSGADTIFLNLCLVVRISKFEFIFMQYGQYPWPVVDFWLVQDHYGSINPLFITNGLQNSFFIVEGS